MGGTISFFISSWSCDCPESNIYLKLEPRSLSYLCYVAFLIFLLPLYKHHVGKASSIPELLFRLLSPLTTTVDDVFFCFEASSAAGLHFNFHYLLQLSYKFFNMCISAYHMNDKCFLKRAHIIVYNYKLNQMNFIRMTGKNYRVCYCCICKLSIMQRNSTSRKSRWVP